jgi:hypothetical protein
MGVTEFTHPRHPGICRRFTADPERAFVVGCDLGKSVDSTVIAIIEYQRIGTGEWREDGTNTVSERYRESFDLRELQRLKLQTSYDEIIDHLVQLMNTEPLYDADLVIDDDGVGRPTGDLIEAKTSLRPMRVTTTGGEQATRSAHAAGMCRNRSLCRTCLVSSLPTGFVLRMICRISKCCAAKRRRS